MELCSTADCYESGKIAITAAADVIVFVVCLLSLCCIQFFYFFKYVLNMFFFKYVLHYIIVSVCYNYVTFEAVIDRSCVAITKKKAGLKCEARH